MGWFTIVNILGGLEISFVIMLKARRFFVLISKLFLHWWIVDSHQEQLEEESRITWNSFEGGLLLLKLLFTWTILKMWFYGAVWFIMLIFPKLFWQLILDVNLCLFIRWSLCAHFSTNTYHNSFSWHLLLVLVTMVCRVQWRAYANISGGSEISFVIMLKAPRFFVLISKLFLHWCIVDSNQEQLEII